MEKLAQKRVQQQVRIVFTIARCKRQLEHHTALDATQQRLNMQGVDSLSLQEQYSETLFCLEQDISDALSQLHLKPLRSKISQAGG